MWRPTLLSILAVILAQSLSSETRAADRPPNILIILTDDVGYGDIGCYGATKVKTPNVDKLAAGGLRFTDGHCPSGTCTPSRYALMTGQYPWRKKGTGILPGDAALIIDPAKPSLPSILQKAGYTTGAVGKWHLGLGAGGDKIDWNGLISPGPKEIGFDYSFLIPATGDRTPCVFVENQQVYKLDPADPLRVSYGKKIGDEPTGREHPELLKMKLSAGHDATIINGISRIGFMTGGKAARWVDEDIADTLTGKAIDFITASGDKPFFLYFATHDIHVPRVPNERYKKTSECGVRGDAIQQMDGSVGQVLGALEKLGLEKDTLVLFSSDNGPVLDDGYADGAVKDLNGHKPNGPFRGGKYSLLEGGHRMPFIVRWPAKVKPGVSDKVVSLIDLFASFAALTGQTLPADAAPDSLNLLPALLGEPDAAGRDYLVMHANGIAIRKGPWKLVPPGAGLGVGGMAAEEPAPAKVAGHGAVLFNVVEDPGELKDVADAHPDVVKELTALLQKVKDDGRTRPIN